MLLVHDDQSEVVDRGEHRRACPDHDVDLSTADAVPLVVTFTIRQAAVLDGDAIAEQRPERPGDSRCQRNLGHEHDDAAPCAGNLLGQAQIELGLAAAGDPVQDSRGERPGLRQSFQPIEGVALFLRQLVHGRASVRGGGVLRGIALDTAAGERHQTELGETFQDRRRNLPACELRGLEPVAGCRQKL